jgi:hypothetical protein
MKASLAASEIHGGRLIVSCSPGHPAVCRCCNLCPKNKELRERLARRLKFAFTSPSSNLAGAALHQSINTCFHIIKLFYWINTSLYLFGGLDRRHFSGRRFKNNWITAGAIMVM